MEAISVYLSMNAMNVLSIHGEMMTEFVPVILTGVMAPLLVQAILGTVTTNARVDVMDPHLWTA